MKIEDMPNWTVFWHGTAVYCKLENYIVDIVYGEVCLIKDLTDEVKALQFQTNGKMVIQP